MLYTIQQMSQLSGVSGRTLRYYDAIGLLMPHEISAAGYRKYSQVEINRLQQILLYKEMGLKLAEIKIILSAPMYSVKEALEKQKEQMLLERVRVEKIIQTITNTLEEMKGSYSMTNEEKFQGLKVERIHRNEEKYGQEIREKYGEEVVEKSNKRQLNMSETAFNEMGEIEEKLLEKLTVYLSTPMVDTIIGQEIFDLHKKWLLFSWDRYEGEVHKGLGVMYVGDERFTAYYDEKSGVGAAVALNQIIQYYALNCQIKCNTLPKKSS